MISRLRGVGESWAQQAQRLLCHQIDVMWVRRTWGASAQAEAVCLQGGGGAEQPGHGAALGTHSPSLHAAGVFQTSLGFPHSSVRETLLLKVLFVICLIFNLDCVLPVRAARLRKPGSAAEVPVT